MELKWLEDFVELAATRNFSMAAAARHVTQPAFSRRIQALENWVGTELVDRNEYPIKLTAAGETFLEVGRDLIRDMYRVRDDCRQQSGNDEYTLSISAFHTIALNILPDILATPTKAKTELRTRMHETDFHGCIETLVSGRCDVAFCYSHAFGPPVPQNGQIVCKTIELEKLCFVCAPDSYTELTTGRTWQGKAEVPLISYSPECFLAKLQTRLMAGMAEQGMTLVTAYESTFTEGIKRMILAGRGVGWLPMSVIRHEVESGQLRILSFNSKDVDLKVLALRRRSIGISSFEQFWAGLPDHDETGAAARG
ncbi:LysR family transcriptional regulator [Salipiger sp. P9]|uniref:LysR family transcriptional regulator n=1 Tax=Salipiger pentaromativorans TaxID=2943193 RepID=UPI002156FC38|nr:LysR family transcriptional regulator [Salipiger pentaromativorans]MCR8548152.1 LysR family transcriptional regulator [Salipiger pentaromativorans]